MRKTIPVIRTAALVPLLKWLAAHGHPVEQMLRDEGLGYTWVGTPQAPVPVRALERLLIRAEALEGPDLGCKIVTAASLEDISTLGQIALGAHTPREAFLRIAWAMPHHCSHEFISVVPGAESSVVSESWTMRLDPVALHIIQQFVAAMFQLIARLALPGQRVLEEVSIAPHPVFGVEPLRPFFAARLVPATGPVLSVRIANTVLDTPFLPAVRERVAGPVRMPQPQMQDRTMAGSARVLVRAMLAAGAPTVERLAAEAGLSVRTLQRRLGDEGLTFSDLVEEQRREAALAALGDPEALIGEVSADLGYARQSSLTRAMRRWTGRPPSAMREAGGG